MINEKHHAYKKLAKIFSGDWNRQPLKLDEYEIMAISRKTAY